MSAQPTATPGAASAPIRASARDSLFEEEALGKAYDARLLRRLWPFVAPYWRQVALTIALFVPLLCFELAPAWIVKTGLDRVIVPAATGVPAALPPPATGIAAALGGWFAALLRGPDAMSPLLWLATVYFAVSALSGALEYLDQSIMGRTGQSAMRDLRNAVFAQIQRLHIGFFDTMPVGRLVTRATNDVENVAEMFSAGIVAMLRDVLRMLGIAIALFLVEPYLAFVTFLIVPLMAVAATVFRLKVRAAFRAVRVRIARINAYVQENVTGMRVVQLFTREPRNQRDFDAMNADHRDAWLQSIRYDSALFAAVELASNLTIAIVLWQGAGLAAAGTIYVFFDWMRRFFMPLRDLSAKYSVMQSSMASCERIFHLFDTQPAVLDRPGAQAPARRSGHSGGVEFDHVWFAYGQDAGRDEPDWVLRDVSCRVAPGERVALVGATGSGKTTVIKLLTRLYDVQRGSIRIDGVDIRDWPQTELRRRIAMVLQDVFLFSGSVADNISLERAGVGTAEVRSVAQAVHADAFVSRLPDGFATPVRERGGNFSAGQRQLLSFARALAHGADILVLDEATSSIDTETEALVQKGIHTLMQGRTAIVIAHRLSTIEDVDRIYVLQRGRLVESGRHEELLARGGVYERLHRLQAASGNGVAALAV